MLWLRQACSSSLWCCLMVFYPLYIFLFSWRIKLFCCFLFLPTSFVVTSAVFPSSAPGVDRVSLLLPCLAKATPSSSLEVSSGDFRVHSNSDSLSNSSSLTFSSTFAVTFSTPLPKSSRKEQATSS